MANRFLETNYYKSPFVRSLKGALKGLYSFIICDCTPDGIWNKDIQAASMYIGFPVTEEEFYEAFVLTGKSIDIGRGKYFFPDFIEHQYPSGLQSWNKSHNKIIIELKKYDFLSEKKEHKGIIFYIEKKGASKGLQSPHIRTQGNGNGNSINNNTLSINNINTISNINKENDFLKNLKNNRDPEVPTKENVWEIFQRAGGTREMAKSFYEKYEGTGWVLSGSPVTNFIPLANKFIDNWKRNENKKQATVNSTNVKIILP